mmetsp:Transcript_117475/g.230515  ORF Transcript_117475/g.230515 Transcript_117475/m.230515 type:complete len:115 (-) Transcript_117475:189-533(-)
MATVVAQNVIMPSEPLRLHYLYDLHDLALGERCLAHDDGLGVCMFATTLRVATEHTRVHAAAAAVAPLPAIHFQSAVKDACAKGAKETVKRVRLVFLADIVDVKHDGRHSATMP